MCFSLLSWVGLVSGRPVPSQCCPVAISPLALRLGVSSARHSSCLTTAGGQESGLALRKKTAHIHSIAGGDFGYLDLSGTQVLYL